MIGRSVVEPNGEYAQPCRATSCVYSLGSFLVFQHVSRLGVTSCLLQIPLETSYTRQYQVERPRFWRNNVRRRNEHLPLF